MKTVPKDVRRHANLCPYSGLPDRYSNGGLWRRRGRCSDADAIQFGRNASAYTSADSHPDAFTLSFADPNSHRYAPKHQFFESWVTILVAEGDSISVEYGGYYTGAFKARHPDIQMHIKAVGGSGLDMLAKRQNEALALKPDVLTVFIGANDLGNYTLPTPISPISWPTSRHFASRT